MPLWFKGVRSRTVMSGGEQPALGQSGFMRPVVVFAMTRRAKAML
jgi:hypothetical protein